MKVVVLGQNYLPEEQNAYFHEMTTGMLARGHDVTMLTAFPHYGRDRVFDGYRGKIFQREVIDGVKVIRTWVYASGNKNVLARILNFASFCLSSVVFGAFAIHRTDVVYTSIPPLPLGVVGVILSRIWRARLVVSIQDIFPLAAVQLGVLTNQYAIRFFEAMEKWMYRKADHIVVISEGFKTNLLSKGVPPAKITVVSNWADPSFVKAGPRNESLRQEFNVGENFTVIYSGGLTRNSALEPLIQAADMLRNEPFSFVIIGEGVHKERLRKMAESQQLTNLQFRTFVPLRQYPEVLLAADVNIVTLNSRATEVSVPSKIYKHMASGRPVIAIASSDSELARLVEAGKFGFTVPTDDPSRLVDVLRWAAVHPEEMKQMGLRARQYLIDNHSRDRSIDRICAVLDGIVPPASP